MSYTYILDFYDITHRVFYLSWGDEPVSCLTMFYDHQRVTQFKGNTLWLPYRQSILGHIRV